MQIVGSLLGERLATFADEQKKLDLWRKGSVHALTVGRARRIALTGKCLALIAGLWVVGPPRMARGNRTEGTTRWPNLMLQRGRNGQTRPSLSVDENRLTKARRRKNSAQL